MSELELAAVFGEVVQVGDCWRWFEATREEPPKELMAERAIELYRVTEPGALADEEETGDAAQFAASMLRDIADGYAMLARPLTPEQRTALPLPERAENQRTQLIRTFGIDGWAAELGYALDLPEHSADAEETEPDEQLVDRTRPTASESADAFLRFFLSSAYAYDLLAVLCDSPAGREVLRNDYFKEYATHQLAQARRWVRRVMRHLPDAAATAAVVSLSIAHGFFLASCGAVSSSATLFPTIPVLGDRLRESGSYDWLLHQDVSLPQWLTEGN